MPNGQSVVSESLAFCRAWRIFAQAEMRDRMAVWGVGSEFEVRGHGDGGPPAFLGLYRPYGSTRVSLSRCWLRRGRAPSFRVSHLSKIVFGIPFGGGARW